MPDELISKLERSDQAKILFIVGSTRSGSTMLEQLLSVAPGTVAVGEMAYLWEESVRNKSYCGCGAKWSDCPFWKSIIERLPKCDFQNDRSPDTRQFWAFFSDLLHKGQQSRNVRYQRFLEQLQSVYLTLSEQSGGKVIIDSSKKPIFALALSNLPHVQAIFVHLVRDSRGCAYSWKNRKARAELGNNKFMPQRPVYRSALAWVGNNLQAEILRTQQGEHILLRYEDLVTDPTFEANKILSRIGLAPISAGDNGLFHPPVSHGIWGNPDRWSSMRAIKVTRDERWITGLSARDFALTTLISAPLLARYRYSVFGSRRHEE
jgi:hypothetical protein